MISNSTNAGEEYLAYPKENIRSFLGDSRIKALFVPYAGITISYDDYEKKVKERFNEIGHDIISIHHYDDPVQAVKEADAIVTGGGNTFRLAELLQKNGLIESIRKRVLDNIPYIGWSAGANIACPTICTTNDMPVVQPPGFEGFNLVNFQINPHFTDLHYSDHAGETREMRISEFIEINPGVYVVGLREGSMLLLENGTVKLIGPHTMRIFRYGYPPVEIGPDDDAGFLA